MKGNIIDLPEKYPKEGEVYKHYKGDHYKVTCLALHSNDEMWMVVYEPMYDNPDAPYFTRPLDDWYELVTYEDTHEHMQRFTLISEDVSLSS